MSNNSNTQHLGQAVEALRKKSATGRGQKKKDFMIFVVFTIILIAVLELVIRALKVPIWIIPPPSKIATETIANFQYILPHIGITLMEIVFGYIIGAIVGISLAALFYRYQILDKLLTPYILLMVATPMVSLVPLLMLWLGFSPLTKIIAVTLGSFPVILINSALGFKSTDSKRIALGKSLCATEGQIFRMIIFPSALPAIFTGLIIGGIFAIITAVGAEFAGGGAGLGNRILYYSSLLQTPLVFGIIIILALMGVSIYLFMTYLANKYTKWYGN